MSTQLPLDQGAGLNKEGSGPINDSNVEHQGLIHDGPGGHFSTDPGFLRELIFLEVVNL